MRWDEDARLIEVSMRAVAARHGPETVTSASPARARWGTLCHERHRERREAEGAQGEQPVQLEREIRGWTLRLRGRVDILEMRGDGLVVEEVKSVVGSAGTSPKDAMTASALAVAVSQVSLYALALDDGEQPLLPRVVAVPIDPADGALSILEVPYRREEVESLLVALAGALIDEVEAFVAEERRRRQWAERLRFPYEAPRPHQQELSEIVAAGLADNRPVLFEAPTGIGKTVAALLPAMRHGLAAGRSTLYLTAKATQREGVAKAFDDLAAAAEGELLPLRALTLRRKEQMCPPKHLRCHPQQCSLLADFEPRLAKAGIVDELQARGGHIAPEELFRRGAAAELCPYEVMTRLAKRADLVIGDYNHRFDRAPSPAGPGPMVVVDEAHNLFDRARELASPFLATESVRQARERARGERDDKLAGRVASLTGGVEQAFEEALAEAQRDEERMPIEGRFEHRLDADVWLRLALEAEALYIHWRRARWMEGRVERDDPVLALAEGVGRIARYVEDPSSHVGYLSLPEAPTGEGVGLVCVDPARQLERHHRAATGVIVMSATLSPNHYYAEVLGLSRLDPVITCAPSPFPEEHREIMVVPTVRTTFRARAMHLPAIAQLVEQAIAVRPGNYIVFAPSHAMLAELRQALSLPRDQVLIQPPAATPKVRARLLEALRRADRPRLLLAVTGGVFAEGVDLPGEALIGAIIVGPTLPPPTFERLLMQRHFQQRHEAGFAYAMIYPGLRRVIQAAGRVIRTDEDVGVVLLVGERFMEERYADCLPAHWYRHDVRELASEDPIGRLEAFWSSLPC